MASIKFDRVYLALASAPTATLELGSSGKKDTATVLGEIREMANGDLRAVSRVTDQRTLSLTFRQVSQATKATLQSWRGQTVVYRDLWGRVWYGVFFACAITDYVGTNVFDVGVTLQRISYDPNIAGTMQAV